MKQHAARLSMLQYLPREIKKASFWTVLHALDMAWLQAVHLGSKDTYR